MSSYLVLARESSPGRQHLSRLAPPAAQEAQRAQAVLNYTRWLIVERMLETPYG